MLAFATPPAEGLDFAAVKQKYLLRVEANEFSLLLALANGAEARLRLASISKPETKDIGEVLELVKMHDFEVSLRLGEQAWEVFRLDQAVYKKTFEEVEAKACSPKTKFELARLKSTKKTRGLGKARDDRDVLYKPRSDILELANVRLSLPFEIEGFLDGFVLLAQSLIAAKAPLAATPSPRPKSAAARPTVARGGPFRFFDQKWVLSVKGFRFSVEDSPLEVATSDKTSVLRQKKFIRDYIAQTDEYNEHIITANLLALEHYTPPLLVLQLDEVNWVADALFEAVHEEDPAVREVRLAKHLLEFVADSDTGQAKALTVSDVAEATGVKAKLIVSGFMLKLRDLPLKLVDLRLLHFEASLLNLRYVETIQPERLLAGRSAETGFRRLDDALSGELHRRRPRVVRWPEFALGFQRRRPALRAAGRQIRLVFGQDCRPDW